MHLVGFITKKSVTMHGDMKVKKKNHTYIHVLNKTVLRKYLVLDRQ